MNQLGFFDDEPDDAYDRHRERAGEREREKSASSRDIGDLPAVADPARRARCRESLLAHCETYHGETFALQWSPDHLKAIEKLETVIKGGGLYALAMARGSGKTAIELVAAEWAILHGWRRFVVLIGATKADSKRNCNSIKTSIETNELLQGDFPEACYPIQKLEGIVNRVAGQTYKKKPTRIKWSAEELAFPTIPGSPSTGARLYTRGITGAIRGLQDKLPSGETIRPDLVLIDDPQTEKSAKSAPGNDFRESVIKAAILGLAGPGKQIAGFAAVTIIFENDTAARLLDRQRSPEWIGDICSLVPQMPKNMEWWYKYRERRAELSRQEQPLSELTDLYRAEQKIADEGCVMSWPARYEPWQASGIQYAMDLWSKNEAAFLSEYQNRPKSKEIEGSVALQPAKLREQLTHIPIWIVPDWADFLVAFVDVQATMLFYMVTAFNRQLRGAVIGYDGWPSQGRRYFTKSDSRISLQASYGAATAEHALQIGIQDLAAKLLEKSFQTQTKGELAIDLVMIDANYAASTEIVYQLARTIGGGKVIPAHGRYFGATTSSIDSWKKEPGDKAGPGWRLQLGKKRQRHFINDVNYWKTIAASRLQTSPDTLGIGFYGSSHQEHALLIDHCSSEYAIDHESQGRKLRDWKLKPGRDNDFWDGLVGCCVGASYLGAEVPGHTAKPKARRVSFAEMQAKRKSGL